MNATDHYKAGHLPEAIDAQIKEVKASPGDHAKRLFLFELLAFAGDLERARKQIDAVSYDQLELEVAVLNYRKILDAEQARRRFFGEGAEPKFLLPPAEHVQLRVQAVHRLREKKQAEAVELLARADAAAPAAKGLLNMKPFDSLRDCDDLFGPVLEVFAQGVYYWVPLEQVDALAAHAPRFPRDLLWLPARLEVRDGPSGEVFLPTVYPGSHEHPDSQIKLGRATDWKTDEAGPVVGLGGRVFLAGGDDINLLEWRQLQMA
jgi:type VI secretion system protein ImpE